MTDDQIRVRITVTVTRQQEGVPRRATRSAIVERIETIHALSRSKLFAADEVDNLITAASDAIR